MSKRKLIVVNAAEIAAAAGIPVPQAAPMAASRANTTMTYLPRVIATAVESGHSALRHLAEITGPAFAAQEREGRMSRVESLLAMLGDINECLVARHNGAKNLTNAMIDESLVKAGVKEARPVKGEAGAVGYKSGASRYIALVTFENNVLWPSKKSEALRAITATGIQFEGNGPVFKSPFDAVKAGYSWSSVHDVWANTVRQLNQQVSPTAVPTKFERIQKSAIGLTLDERKALLAAIFGTIPGIEQAQATEPVTPPVEAPVVAAVQG